VTDQLCFEFAERVSANRQELPQNGEPELRRQVPAGAERLLAALVRRGLHERDLRAAALLCWVMDETASP
jgi:hypothetical protein